MICRWNGRNEPRLVAERHEDGCRNDQCRGCQPCTEPHCRVCNRTHADGACAECLAETRDDLRETARMIGDLPAEVESRGINGEAMTLLGPVADPEARGHLEASVAAGRVSRDVLEASHLKDCDDPRCTGCAGELHPGFVLLSWQMVWRDALDHDEAPDAEIPTAVDYLDKTMAYMGTYPHVPFEDFARDLRRCRSHIEAVLHDGEQVERGAPCPDCGKTLERHYGSRVADDRWTCPSRRCGVSYSTAQYRGWVEEDARNEATVLTAANMALRFTSDETELKASVVRVWGARGLIRKRGRDDNGMTLYDVGDVEARLSQVPRTA